MNTDDLANARANWKQGSALEEVHDRINGKQIVHPTPVELRKPDTLDPGYIQGKAFSSELIQLRQDGVLERAGLTPSHVRSLQNIAALLEKGNNVQKMNSITKSLALLGQAAPAIYGHPVGVGAIATEFAASKLLGRLITSPELASTLENVLKSNLTTAAASRAVNKVLLDGRSFRDSP